MQAATIPAGSNQLVLNYNNKYIYTVKPVEITNLLATGVVVLQEYSVVDMEGKVIKLYKTGVGNWYDLPEMNADAQCALLSLLKSGIDLKNRLGDSS